MFAEQQSPPLLSLVLVDVVLRMSTKYGEMRT